VKQITLHNFFKKSVAKLCLALVIFIININNANAQSSLSEEEFLNIIKTFHPQAKQINIINDKANANKIAAQAGFDPEFKFDNGRKTFDGTSYYNLRETKLNVPTWYGIDVYAGFENLTGLRTDPTNTIGRTSYAGVSVPLAKGLLMDKRRAALQSARIVQKQSLVEQQIAFNDLTLDALQTYYNWEQAWQVKTLLDSAVEINKRRLVLIKRTIEVGERAPIDSIEAITQLQTFELQQTQAAFAVQEARYLMSQYLWLANDVAYELPENITPNSIGYTSMLQNLPPTDTVCITTYLPIHIELRNYNFKLNILEIDRKLKFQEFLPTINGKYQQLGKGYQLGKTIAQPLFNNNFNYGLEVKIPLRFSSGRGQYRLAKLKIQETNWQLADKRNELTNKIKIAYANTNNINQQRSIQNASLTNFKRLLRVEELRLLNGESSLFLINSREQKVFETAIKLAEITIKQKLALAKVWHAAGQLINQF
jgi:outer membrane protein TolC